MNNHRLKLIFSEDTPRAEIEEAVEVSFGGMGTAYRGPGDRIVFLHKFEMPYELVIRQLTALQQDGFILSWEVA